MSEDQLYSYTCDVLDLLEGTGITEDNLDGNLVAKCLSLGMGQHAAAEYIKLAVELAREREITQGLQIQLAECDCEKLRGEVELLKAEAILAAVSQRGPEWETTFSDSTGTQNAPVRQEEE